MGNLNPESISVPRERVIALAGNPNVGKSTVFNALTGMNQHTGNWPGKTVEIARGTHRFRGNNYIFIDLPGTYSLTPNSAEEEIARDFILHGGADAVIAVCDATCLERNLNLVLQIMEMTPRVLICVNLMDEAEKKNIYVDLNELENQLGVPVAGTSARNGKGLDGLIEKAEALCSGEACLVPRQVSYPEAIEKTVLEIQPSLEQDSDSGLSRWSALRILEMDPAFTSQGGAEVINAARKKLYDSGYGQEEIKDMIVSGIVMTAEDIAERACPCRNQAVCNRDRRLDRILTGKLAGIPVMLALLCGVFWLTITGANYPSRLLSSVLFGIQDKLTELFALFGAPGWLHGVLVMGMYRVLAWVVSVMLPPMVSYKKNRSAKNGLSKAFFGTAVYSFQNIFSCY